MKLVRIATLLVVLAGSSCGVTPPACTTPLGGDTIYVVGHGWHAEIGIPVEQIDGPLGFYRTVFPGARVLMFGYGKRTFITAPARTLSEYVVGPFPGPAVIQVTGLTVAPPAAYKPEDVVTLSLPPGGRAGLTAALWDDLQKDTHGAPRLVSVGDDPVSVFYAARSGYSLMHTCNAWVADLLHTAGLPVSGEGVVFSDQVMARTAITASAQCRATSAHDAG